MESYEITRFVFQRALAFIYFFGFLIVINQFRGLIGEKGLEPAIDYVKKVKFKYSPSLFIWVCRDSFMSVLGWFGFALSLFALSGHSEFFGVAVSVVTWFLLWILYLSFVNVGRTFYGFGWESLLLEIGFLAIFLGPVDIPSSKVLMLLNRWILFRVMFGAGLIKLRGDPCWWNLTCMNYHYETQPMPNPLSWYFHHLPKSFHKMSVAFTHFVELIVPFGVFAFAPISYLAGGLIAFFQLMLILSGNLSWLNYVTLVLCIPCFDDAIWSAFLPWVYHGEIGSLQLLIVVVVTLFILILSIRPTINLFSPFQSMNRSFDSLHLVNTYGAFGSVTKKRYEIIIEGTENDPDDPDAIWKAYEFKGKPGKISRMPPIVSPYHLRLDWQMWFAAMSPPQYNPWVYELLYKLLLGDENIVKLLKYSPFQKDPPLYVRAQLYLYTFTSWGDKTGNWWNRQFVGVYIPAVSMVDFH